MVHIEIPVLKAIVDIHIEDFPGLILTRDDVIDLEHLVTFQARNAQESVMMVGQRLAKWHEERVLRPERVKMRKAGLARTELRKSSRQRALRRAEPAYRRRHAPRSVQAAMQDPRVRGQIV